MGYCVEADVKKTGGVYLNKSVPNTSNLDIDEMIDRSYHEINSLLFTVGIAVPVSATLLKARAILKAINCYGALSQTEGALRTRAVPGNKSIELISNYYRKLFRDRMKAIMDYPKSLFAEEADADLGNAYTSKLLVRPTNDMFYDYNSANNIKATFDVDDQY